jgi:hypothetical protein
MAGKAFLGQCSARRVGGLVRHTTNLRNILKGKPSYRLPLLILMRSIDSRYATEVSDEVVVDEETWT